MPNLPRKGNLVGVICQYCGSTITEIICPHCGGQWSAPAEERYLFIKRGYLCTITRDASRKVTELSVWSPDYTKTVGLTDEALATMFRPGEDWVDTVLDLMFDLPKIFWDRYWVKLERQ